MPCGQGTVCDVGSEHPGACVAPGSGCVISSPAEPCGQNGATTCGPGTMCDGVGQCFPVLPCAEMECQGSTCWGKSCPCRSWWRSAQT
ncbi:MAG: hypothetical protein HY744_12385 [Deltaproteobacteria bacterium]|nr:hypothetical protein [Deltaproteobacteria bacterium]